MTGRAYTESFARIYDDIMKAVPYDLWFSYIQELLDYYDHTPSKVLDLACGTGNMSLRLARHGWEVTGVDKSGPMLEVASAKAHRQALDIDWVEADLRELQLENNFDLAISLFDSLNYILEFQELIAIFQNVYQVLDDRGLFIFDLNTVQRLMSIEPGTTMLTGDNYTCFWQDIIDNQRKIWRVKLKIYLEGERVNYFEEVHEETSYPVEQVKAALYETGFSSIEVFKAYSFKKGNDQDNRLYFVCFKEETTGTELNFFDRLINRINWRLKKVFLHNSDF